MQRGIADYVTWKKNKQIFHFQKCTFKKKKETLVGFTLQCIPAHWERNIQKQHKMIKNHLVKKKCPNKESEPVRGHVELGLDALES